MQPLFAEPARPPSDIFYDRTLHPFPARTPLPADDLERRLTIARQYGSLALPHIGLVGDTYTIPSLSHDTKAGIAS